MDDVPTLDAATSLASSGLTFVASAKGKPRAACAPRKTAAQPKKKKLTPEERAMQSAKRKGRRHAQDARDEAAAVATLTAAT